MPEVSHTLTRNTPIILILRAPRPVYRDFSRAGETVYFLYTLLTATGALLLLPYFAFERWRRGKYFHGVKERRGYLSGSARAPRGVPGAVWIHAVSVGE